AVDVAPNRRHEQPALELIVLLLRATPLAAADIRKSSSKTSRCGTSCEPSTIGRFTPRRPKVATTSGHAPNSADCADCVPGRDHKNSEQLANLVSARIQTCGAQEVSIFTKTRSARKTGATHCYPCWSCCWCLCGSSEHRRSRVRKHARSRTSPPSHGCTAWSGSFIQVTLPQVSTGIASRS